MDQQEDDRSVGGKAPRRGRVVATAEKRGGFFAAIRSPMNAAYAAAQAVRGVLASPRDVPPSRAQHDGVPAAVQPPPVSNAEALISVVPAASTVIAEVPSAKPVVQNGLTQNWSPDKMASLAMFLQSNPNKPAGNPIVSVQEQHTERPYYGLRYLLENGVPGIPLPEHCLKRRQVAGPSRLVSDPPPRFGQQPSIGSSRYHPYSRAPPSRPKPTTGFSNGFSLHGTGQGTPLPSLPAAPASLVPVAAAPQPLALMPPPSAAADMSRQGMPAARTPAGLAPLPMSLTPYPKPAAGSTTPSLGAKRARDTPSVTPIVGSGIKNLAEYKRQRQRYTQPASRPLNALLGGGSLMGTPRDNGHSSRSNSASLAASPYGSDAGQDRTHDHMTPGGVKAPTETARRILETLDNMAKSSENNTPQGKTPKASANSTPLGLARPGSTPFPKGPLGGVPPPPLDRISPNATPASGVRTYGLIQGRTGLSPSPQPQGALALTPAQASPERPASQDNLLPAPMAMLATESSGMGSLPAMPDYVPPTAIVVSSNDVLAVMKPAAAGRPRSADRHHKSVRFNVPEELQAAPGAVPGAAFPSLPAAVAVAVAPAQQEDAQRPAFADQDNASGTPVFVFGQPRTAEDGEVEEAVRRVCKSVDVNAWTGEVPTFAFKAPTAWDNSTAVGTIAEVVVQKPTSVQTAVQPPTKAWPVPGIQSESLQQQVQMAADVPLPDDDDIPLQTSPQQPLPAAASPTPAAPVSSGWGDAFLKANQASISAASDATAKEIEKAKTPSPAPAPSAFGFSFGATPSASPAPTPVQASEVVVSSGWGDAFLQKAQSAFSAASDATAKEIEKAKTPEPTPASTFNFGASSFPAPAWGATPTAGPSPAPDQSGVAASSTLAMAMSPAPEAATTQAAPASPAVHTFGASSSSALASSGPINFGLSPTPEPQPHTQAFGSQPAFTSFGSTTPAFGTLSASAPSFGATTIPGTPGFASNTTQQQQQQQQLGSSIGFTFGATPAPQTAAAGTPGTPTFTFGGGAAVPAWGATPAPAPTPVPTSFAFGAGSSAVPVASASAFNFGAGAGSAASGAAPASSFVFGGAQPAASSAPVFGFGSQSSAAAFGATPAATPAAQAASVFGATPGPVFGSTPAASPAPNTFGQPGATPFVFGNPQGDGPPSVSPFGAGTTNFLGSTPSPGPSFGGLATPPTFGAANAHAGSAPFMLGGATSSGVSGTPGFGAPPQQPVFGSPLTPADPGASGFGAGAGAGADAAGAGGLGMSLGDFKSGDRRKIRARRHQ